MTKDSLYTSPRIPLDLTFLLPYSKPSNNLKQQKSVYTGVLIEIQGRVGSFDVLVEKNGTEPLIGQIVLEELDLVVKPGTKTLIPNPRSPELPMVEILKKMEWVLVLFKNTREITNLDSLKSVEIDPRNGSFLLD